MVIKSRGKYDSISDFNSVPLVIDWNIHRNKIAVENNNGQMTGVRKSKI